MLVRIRLGKGAKVERKNGKNRRLALAFASILTPGAVMAAALGIWGLAAGPNWVSHFAIGSGLFSHWQVWVAFAAVLQTGAHLLNRYGRGGKQVTAPASGQQHPLIR